MFNPPCFARVLSLVVIAIAFSLRLHAAAPVDYILDTDIASDCDDAAAVAMVNALADKGEVNVLAMMVSTGGHHGAPAVCAINTWYGHPDIPVGTLKNPEFWVGGSPDERASWLNFESYNDYLAKNYPTRIEDGDDAPDACVLYRKILASRPDASVIIGSIGPLINLANLMHSKPDAASPLDGMTLIRKKVKLLVIAGGRNPEGTSSNFSKAGAGAYAKPVIEEWPGPMVFVGNDVGGEIKTGWTKNKAATEGNPARTAYRLFHKGNDDGTRGSNDQCGVLYAIRGAGALFALVTDGHMTCTPDGHTAWDATPDPARKQVYVRKLDGVDAQLAATIEDLMTQSRKSAN